MVFIDRSERRHDWMSSPTSCDQFRRMKHDLREGRMGVAADAARRSLTATMDMLFIDTAGTGCMRAASVADFPASHPGYT